MADFRLRTMEPRDRAAVADLIYISINYWYQTHGHGALFSGGPGVTEVFYDVYEALDPGCGVVAESVRTGRLMGSCFYHPREHHVSLGIMNVHPNYFGHGAARAMLEFIIEFAERERKPLRLTQSAMNLDSYSLYTRAGFVPRQAYQDMVLAVPKDGLPHTTPGTDRVRPATIDDVAAMGELEMAVGGICREKDYRYCIENRDGFWQALVAEGDSGGLDGFLISCGHGAMNMLGPGVVRAQEPAAALILRSLDAYRGRAPVFLVPVDCDRLVRQMYSWGARNCELHFCQVRGEFRPFAGVNMPTFLPETG